MASRPLAVGDRVRVYGHNEGEVFAGEVCDGIDPAGKGRIAVCRDGTRDDSPLLYLCHPKQCRRLKPRAKSVRVTRRQLEEAWREGWVSKDGFTNTHYFQPMAKALGFEVSE